MLKTTIEETKMSYEASKDMEKMRAAIANAASKFTEQNVNKIALDFGTVSVLMDSQGKVSKQASIILNLSFASMGQIFYDAMVAALEDQRDEQ